ncbi:MAG: hypothetical protein AB8I08_26880 [Sandaracinaceae bacterium]
MRRAALLVILCLAGCGETATPTEPTAESPGVQPIGAGEAADLPSAPHGGSTLQVGPHLVEVLFFEDGSLHAWMLGHDVPRASALQLQADAPTVDGVRGVPLAWNPEEARFEGQADAGAAVGRFELRLEVAGQTHRGAMDPLSFRASEAAAEPAEPVVTPTPVAPVAAVPRPAARGRRRAGSSSATAPEVTPEPTTPEPTTPATEPTTPSPTGGRRVRPQ